MERASKWYHEGITPEGIEYLTGPKRGLTEEAIERFRIGVVSAPLPGHEQYTGMISIPYLTAYGIVSIRFRQLGDKQGPKYLSTANDPPRIYNVADLQLGTRGICVTEGAFDCIVAKMCDLPTIGLMSATSWQQILSLLLVQYDQVMLLQHDDEAGRKMAQAMAKDLPNLRPVVMTGGDVTSLFLDQGRAALRGKVLGT